MNVEIDIKEIFLQLKQKVVQTANIKKGMHQLKTKTFKMKKIALKKR